MRRTVLIFITFIYIISVTSCTCRSDSHDGDAAVHGIEAVAYPRPKQTPAYGYMTSGQRTAYDALSEFADMLCASAGRRDLVYSLPAPVSEDDMRTAREAYGGDFGIILPPAACYIGEIRDEDEQICALYYGKSELFTERYERYLRTSAAADGILAALPHDGSDRGKALAIAKWLVSNVSRTESAEEADGASADSAYSALIDGTAADRGCAEAFDLLCKKAGLRSICVTGDTGKCRRTWNMVGIEDEWYHVDTWAMTERDPYSSFMIPDRLCMEEGQHARYFEDRQTGQSRAPSADSFDGWEYYFPTGSDALRYFSERVLSDSTQYYAYIGKRSDRGAFLSCDSERISDESGIEFVMHVISTGQDKPCLVTFEKNPQ